jgi:hypothetical protein
LIIKAERERERDSEYSKDRKRVLCCEDRFSFRPKERMAFRFGESLFFSSSSLFSLFFSHPHSLSLYTLLYCIIHVVVNSGGEEKRTKEKNGISLVCSFSLFLLPFSVCHLVPPLSLFVINRSDCIGACGGCTWTAFSCQDSVVTLSKVSLSLSLSLSPSLSLLTVSPILSP